MAKSFHEDLCKAASFVANANDKDKLGDFSNLEIKTNAGRRFIEYSLANAQLFDRKQQDYGPRNISGFGTFGVVVRMNDKFERLKTLFGKGRRKRATNESIIDTLRDISNYATIALMVERGEWPNE